MRVSFLLEQLIPEMNYCFVGHPPNLSMEESRAQSRDDAGSDHESRMDQSHEDREEEEENESNDEGVVEGEDAPGEDDEDYPEEDREDMMQEYEHEGNHEIQFSQSI